MILKFLQWNVLYKEKIDRIAAQITKINPDIITLQELSKGLSYNGEIDTVQYIADKLDCKFTFHKDRRFSNNGVVGNGIFSRFPLVKSSYFYTMVPRKVAGGGGKSGSVYIESEIDVKGRNLAVATDHLFYVSRFRITPDKIAETESFVDIIKKRKKNYIVSGDFNATPDTNTIKQISRYVNCVGPGFAQKTAFSKPIIDQSGWKAGFDWRLDYVFATPDLKVKSAKIIKTPYSDHMPILVEFEV